MTMANPRRNPPAVQSNFPTFTVDYDAADQAYFAFSALRRMAQAEPMLASNPYFCALQDTAYARFLGMFEATP